MKEINLKDCFIILKMKKKFIIALTILFVLAVGTLNYITFSPTYKASTKVMIGEVEKPEGIEIDQRYINQKNINNYSEISKSRLVMDEVKKNLKIESNYKEIVKNIEVKILPETNFIEIEVTGNESEMVSKVANEIVTVSIKYAKDIAEINNIKVVDKASPSKEPIKSNSKTNAILGGVLGLMIGIILTFAHEGLDTTIKTPQDIKKYLDLPITGILPSVNSKLIMDEEPDSFTFESYRSLRTNIEFLNNQKEIKSMLITSPVYNVDKSIVSANIAIAIAQTQKRVLLVDGNLRKPEIHQYFALKNENGLSNILNENIDYKKVIHILEKEKNLHILTSGSNFKDSGELLTSKKMKDFIKEVNNEYDIIILNSPSLGIITDATVLSTIADGTMLVCKSGQSNINEIKMGKNILDKVDANILGVILTGLSDSEDDYYKYYKNSYLHYNENNI